MRGTSVLVYIIESWPPSLGSYPCTCSTDHFIVSSALYTEQQQQQQQCGVANLPAFGNRKEDANFLGRPPADRLQAIVPAYTFNCTGRVTEWSACVEPGGGRERYYIQFQVWRPTRNPGCYSLVEYNAPPDPIISLGVLSADQLLQPGDPENHCVHLPVNEDEQIEFQPGDVIGYYVDRFKDDDKDHDGGGIQVISDQNVVVYQRRDVLLSSLTRGVFAGLSIAPSHCQTGILNWFEMLSTTNGAPIISLSLSTGPITATSTSPLTSTPLVSSTLLTSTLPLPSTMPISVPTSPGGVPSSGNTATTTAVITSSPSSAPSGRSRDSGGGVGGGGGGVGGGGGGGGGEDGGSKTVIWVAVTVPLVVLILATGMLPYLTLIYISSTSQLTAHFSLAHSVIALSTLVIVIMYKNAKRNHYRGLTNPSYDITACECTCSSSP